MKMRKLLAIVMTLALVMSFSVSALATYGDGDGTITVNNAHADTELELYQILTYTLNAQGNYSNVQFAQLGYKTQFIAAINNSAINETSSDLDIMLYITNTYYGADGVTAEGNAFARRLANLLEKFVTDNTIPKYASETANQDSVLFTDVEMGYYLILDVSKYDPGTTAITMLTPTKLSETITLKSTEVTPLEKDIVGKSVVGYDIGDMIDYSVKVRVPDYTDFASFEMIFTDTLGTGLEFPAGLPDPTITLKGVALTSGWSHSYSGDVLTITFDEINTTFSASNIGEELEITYSAKVNDKASQEDGELENTVNYIVNNSPSIDTSATTNTYGFVVDKYDFDDKTVKLENVEFILYIEETDDITSDEYPLYYIFEENNGVYLYKSTTTDRTDATVMVTNANGAFTAFGVKAGTYFLEETKPYDGYNNLGAPIEIEIGKEGNTFITVDVENVAGIQIPGTGGIGTTLFTIFGGVIILGAFTLLIANRKRIFGK